MPHTQMLTGVSHNVFGKEQMVTRLPNVTCSPLMSSHLPCVQLRVVEQDGVHGGVEGDHNSLWPQLHH
ncbi:hypothetical protein E2C01_014991 [Portunus trituberculatus]|uniref:Uncharacterized protein n=1 Tax=Portunus trituberculatus TaxID=210409 RepID=A0A5B7DLI4_PORTR|nr:hypothetical protein [Portunus trituberculatus]